MAKKKSKELNENVDIDASILLLGNGDEGTKVEEIVVVDADVQALLMRVNTMESLLRKYINIVDEIKTTLDSAKESKVISSSVVIS